MASLHSVRALYAPPLNRGAMPSPSLGGSPSMPVGAPVLSPNPIPTQSVIAPLQRRASGGNPYEAAGTGRRMSQFQPSRLGPTTSLWGTLDLMRARCRDEVRNNPWAASAVDNFESQIIGPNGIRPHWLGLDRTLKTDIETKFRRWCDRVGFYAMQATVAREIFEAGEVFVRYYVRPSSWGLAVPLDLQLIEGEQVPVFLNTIQGVTYGAGTTAVPSTNSIRTGIEFDPDDRVIAYHMYKAHPGETMFYPMEGLTFTRVPAAQILHVFKRLRAGLLRGQPFLGPVLVALHEIGKYMDAAVVKKQIQTMFAGFVEKVNSDSEVLPIDLSSATAGTEQDGSPSPSPSPSSGYDSTVQASRIETGTMQVLLPGEKITFPQLPAENDIAIFLDVCLHQYAAGIGATYEQITGDLKGVNLSSIRAGILDSRRKNEQFQQNVVISQFVAPVVRRWVKEAVIAGELSLPGYADSPEKYENIAWATPGWPWIDPLRDGQARQLEVRSGFTSREAVVADRGDDVADIDSQQVADNERADEAGLVYDSDARHTLLRGEKVTASEEAEADTNDAGDTPAPEPAPAPKPAPKPAPMPAPVKKPIAATRTAPVPIRKK